MYFIAHDSKEGAVISDSFTEQEEDESERLITATMAMLDQLDFGEEMSYEQLRLFWQTRVL